VSDPVSPPLTEPGQILAEWSESDALSITRYGFASVREAPGIIEAAAAARALAAAAARERELVAALRALRHDFRNAEGLNEGLRQMWIATIDAALAAPDAAGQREDAR